MMNRDILATMLACANKGRTMNPTRIENMVARTPSSLSAAVFHMCGVFMTSEHDEEAWLDEAERCLDLIRDMTDSELEREYPGVVVAYRVAAREPVEDPV